MRHALDACGAAGRPRREGLRKGLLTLTAAVLSLSATLVAQGIYETLQP